MGVSLAESCGEGHLVLTIERGGGEPYQGIVPLTGAGIGEALEHYFATSEQLPTRLWLAANDQRAAGLLLQRLPGEERGARGEARGEEQEDDWHRVGLLAATIKPGEFLGLTALDLLHWLYHEDDVRLF